MSISVYRTAEAWWAGTHDAVAKVDTEATTTAALLADREAVEQADEIVRAELGNVIFAADDTTLEQVLEHSKQQ